MPIKADSEHIDHDHQSTAAVLPRGQTEIDSASEHDRGDHKTWKLKVQGALVEFHDPIVLARDAMTAAGFDPEKPWHIFLIVKGREKEEISVDSKIDLRTPGIEKIRLMQRNVDNGDGLQPVLRRAFQLLETDHQYLDGLGLRWETVFIEKKRWLVIHDFLLLPGYTPETSTLALDVPADYPASQIDMFYFAPWVSRSDGVTIPSIQIRAAIDGVEYQGWSRHRNSKCPWDPNTDNVRTHLALVESCLARELGQ